MVVRFKKTTRIRLVCNLSKYVVWAQGFRTRIWLSWWSDDPQEASILEAKDQMKYNRRRYAQRRKDHKNSYDNLYF